MSSLMDKYTTISKKDPRMPANPRSCYGKNGWKGYRNLFGLQNIEHYSLEQLKSKIKQVLKQEGIEPNSIVNIVNKYRTLRIGDIKIPSNPSRFYSKKRLEKLPRRVWSAGHQILHTQTTQICD
ncbi:hypothetical protein D5E85_26515 [Vibrio parahaemolyticus]|nr:hypothetical protein D5E85_26515 [Vibrio parahaemolyticus]